MLPEWTPCQLFITLVTINKGRCLIILARGRSTRSKTSLYSSEKNGDKPCVIFNVVREQLCTNKGEIESIKKKKKKKNTPFARRCIMRTDYQKPTDL